MLCCVCIPVFRAEAVSRSGKRSASECVSVGRVSASGASSRSTSQTLISTSTPEGSSSFISASIVLGVEL